jgi:hypothetical protein
MNVFGFNGTITAPGLRGDEKIGKNIVTANSWYISRKHPYHKIIRHHYMPIVQSRTLVEVHASVTKLPSQGWEKTLYPLYKVY